MRERLKPHVRYRLKIFFKGEPAIKPAREFKEKLCWLLSNKIQAAKQRRENIMELKETIGAMGERGADMVWEIGGKG